MSHRMVAAQSLYATAKYCVLLLFSLNIFKVFHVVLNDENSIDIICNAAFYISMTVAKALLNLSRF